MSTGRVEIEFENAKYIVEIPIAISHALPSILVVLLCKDGRTISKVLRGSMEYNPLKPNKYLFANLQPISPTAPLKFDSRNTFKAKIKP